MPLLMYPVWESQVYGDLAHPSLVMELEEHHEFAFSRAPPACIGSRLETLRLRYGHESDDLYSNMVYHCLVDANGKGHLPSFESLRYLSLGFCSYRVREGPTAPYFASPRHQLDLLSTVAVTTTQPALEAVDLMFSWHIPRGKFDLAQE